MLSVRDGVMMLVAGEPQCLAFFSKGCVTVMPQGWLPVRIGALAIDACTAGFA